MAEGTWRTSANERHVFAYKRRAGMTGGAVDPAECNGPTKKRGAKPAPKKNRHRNRAW